ncbi:hypothetical protein [Chloroflexus sp.]|uniref:hypothetical protein n=1 Tax=Chloroflexus sp. TaxID=1904827 RepID=UPI002ADD86AB|nr:hypothetical protein [Chloroflexus sp.]
MQVQCIPQYACWLTLIELWWQQLRALALKGKRFEALDELAAALQAALDYGTSSVSFALEETATSAGGQAGWLHVVQENQKT